MSVVLPQSEDPFPGAADRALAAAVGRCDELGLDDLGGGADEHEQASDGVSWANDEQVAAMYREADAALLVEATVPTPQWSDTQVVDALAAAERTARAATARGLRLATELARRCPAPSKDP